MLPPQEQFFITLPQMGVLQSAMLWGYVLGQVSLQPVLQRLWSIPPKLELKEHSKPQHRIPV